MNELLEWANNYKQNNPAGWRKWIGGIVVVIVLIIAAAIWAITANIRGSQTASLQTQLDVAQEAARQAETNQQLAQDAQAQQQHAEAARVAREQAATIQQQLESMQAQHDRNTQIIQSIGSWADVDAKVK